VHTRACLACIADGAYCGGTYCTTLPGGSVNTCCSGSTTHRSGIYLYCGAAPPPPPTPAPTTPAPTPAPTCMADGDSCGLTSCDDHACCSGSYYTGYNGHVPTGRYCGTAPTPSPTPAPTTAPTPSPTPAPTCMADGEKCGNTHCDDHACCSQSYYTGWSGLFFGQYCGTAAPTPPPTPAPTPPPAATTTTRRRRLWP